MKGLFTLILLLSLELNGFAADLKSIIVCKQKGSDGNNRTFFIDLGASNLKKAQLIGDAVYFNSNAMGWKVFGGTSRLSIEKATGTLHYTFQYQNLENGYDMNVGSGSIDVQLNADLSEVQDPGASCSVVEKTNEAELSQVGLACSETKTQTDWFIVTGTLSRDLIRASTRPLAASEVISMGSETTRKASLVYLGSGGIDGHYNFMEANAGNIYDSNIKHYVPVTAKVGQKTQVLTSRKYPPEPEDIESKIPCVRKF